MRRRHLTDRPHQTGRLPQRLTIVPAARRAQVVLILICTSLISFWYHPTRATADLHPHRQFNIFVPCVAGTSSSPRLPPRAY